MFFGATVPFQEVDVLIQEFHAKDNARHKETGCLRIFVEHLKQKLDTKKKILLLEGLPTIFKLI